MAEKKGFFKRNFLYILCGTVIVSNMFVKTVIISGRSMTDTYREGQIVLCNKLDKSADVGDVIICTIPSEKLYIKRVIAKGGDVVDINDAGEVFVNGNKLSESYIKDGITKLPVADIEGQENVEIDYENGKVYVDGKLKYESIKFPFTVSENHIFVMGDNRLGSFDSREKNIGEIPQDKIIGTVIGGHKNVVYDNSTNN